MNSLAPAPLYSTGSLGSPGGYGQNPNPGFGPTPSIYSQQSSLVSQQPSYGAPPPPAPQNPYGQTPPPQPAAPSGQPPQGYNPGLPAQQNQNPYGGGPPQNPYGAPPPTHPYGGGQQQQQQGQQPPQNPYGQPTRQQPQQPAYGGPMNPPNSQGPQNPYQQGVPQNLPYGAPQNVGGQQPQPNQAPNPNPYGQPPQQQQQVVPPQSQNPYGGQQANPYGQAMGTNPYSSGQPAASSQAAPPPAQQGQPQQPQSLVPPSVYTGGTQTVSQTQEYAAAASVAPPQAPPATQPAPAQTQPPTQVPPNSGLPAPFSAAPAPAPVAPFGPVVPPGDGTKPLPIRVCVRFCPSAAESGKKCALKLNPGNSREIQFLGEGGPTASSSSAAKFEFDKVFDAENCSPGATGQQLQKSNEALFDDLGPKLLVEALQGQNGTIVAYGARGCGKTTTVSSLLQNFGKSLFEEVKHCEHGKRNKILVNLAVFEVGERGIRDLLSVTEAASPGSGSASPIPCAATDEQPCSLLEHQHLGLLVQGLTRLPCTDLANFTEAIAFAKQRQGLGDASARPLESEKRSLFFQVDLGIQPFAPGTGRPTKLSRVVFVDFADTSAKVPGRGPSANPSWDALVGKQAPQYENRSVELFANTVEQLARVAQGRTKPLLPECKPLFQTSYLAQFLTDSHAGSCRTTWVACVDPSDGTNALQTLQLASKIRSSCCTFPKERVLEETGFQKIQQQLRQDVILPQRQVASMESSVRLGTRSVADLDAAKREVGKWTQQIADLENLWLSSADHKLKLFKEWQLKRDAFLVKKFLHSSSEPITNGCCLVAASEDPALHGQLRFVLGDGKQFSMGSDGSAAANNSLVLKHCFPKKLCYLQAYGEAIFLEISAHGVWLDGRLQGPPGVKVTVNAGSMLVLGAQGCYYSFKIGGVRQPAPSFAYEDPQRSLLANVQLPPEVSSVLTNQGTPPEKASALTEMYKETQHLVVEGNQHLVDVGKGDLEFGVVVLADTSSQTAGQEIFVKLRRKPSVGSGSGSEEVLGLFTRSSFLSRVEEMRKGYGRLQKAEVQALWSHAVSTKPTVVAQNQGAAPAQFQPQSQSQAQPQPHDQFQTQALSSQQQHQPLTSTQQQQNQRSSDPAAEARITEMARMLQEMKQADAAKNEVLKGLKELIASLVREMGIMRDNQNDVKSQLGGGRQVSEQILRHLEGQALGAGGGGGLGGTAALGQSLGATLPPSIAPLPLSGTRASGGGSISPKSSRGQYKKIHATKKGTASTQIGFNATAPAQAGGGYGAQMQAGGQPQPQSPYLQRPQQLPVNPYGGAIGTVGTLQQAKPGSPYSLQGPGVVTATAQAVPVGAAAASAAAASSGNNPYAAVNLPYGGMTTPAATAVASPYGGGVGPNKPAIATSPYGVVGTGSGPGAHSIPNPYGTAPSAPATGAATSLYGGAVGGPGASSSSRDPYAGISLGGAAGGGPAAGERLAAQSLVAGLTSGYR
mmetsp:Transcript_20529/g.51833  ORF Transcript_20529/g.51833 Transcript_20529/m.51833 type:complete len:1485 (+) Transcript_20529:221-4675(+)